MPLHRLPPSRVLAREIAGGGAPILNCKNSPPPRIASAQIDRVRVQRARHQLLSRALGNPDVQSPAAVKMPQALLARGAEGEAQLLGTA